MSEIKRLRVFGGPNGSGKSTLFSKIKEQFSVGHFVNSDEIENEIATKGYINMEQFGLVLTQGDLDLFKLEENTHSLLQKSDREGHVIDVEIRENVIGCSNLNRRRCEGFVEEDNSIEESRSIQERSG